MAEIGIKLTWGRSNLGAHIRWFEYMAGADFHKDIVTKWQRPAHLAKLTQMATEVLQADVYDAYEPRSYQRTGSLLHSPRAKSIGGGDALGETILYLDPTAAPPKAEVSGMNPAKVNYGAFFERPAFNSFIQAEDTTDPVRSRPFYLHMEIEFQEMEEKQAMKAILLTAKFKKPRTISK